MWNMLAIFCLTILVTQTLATSGVNPGTCDIHNGINLGCSTWEEGNRKMCLEDPRPIMYWVAKPVFSELFQLRTSDSETPESDRTFYTPGEIMELHLRVVDPDQKFRGLILYALDDSDARVGEWIISPTERYFWKPWGEQDGHPCQETLYHANADIKPYYNAFKFRAPPVGTGSITFYALIKQGPANRGEFYYPNSENLVLTEGDAPAEDDEIVWVKSNLNQDCEQACRAIERICRPEEMEMIDTEEDMNSIIGTQFSCSRPFVSDCRGLAPGRKDDSCYYKDFECGTNSRDSLDADSSCTVSSPDYERFCSCGIPSESETLPEIVSESENDDDDVSDDVTDDVTDDNQVADDDQVADDNQGGDDEGDDEEEEGTESGDVSSTTRLSANILGALIFLFGSFYCPKKVHTLLVVGLILSLSVSVNGHNWINSRSRVVGASTLTPCVSRTETTPHVQVARNQPFPVEWASGHHGFNYFVLFSAENKDKLFDHRDSLLEQYISEAPENLIQTQPQKYRKLHMSEFEDPSQAILGTDTATPPTYLNVVQEGDPDYIPSLFFDAAALRRYNDNDHSEDFVAMYESSNPEMSHIIGVWKYKINYDVPGEVDIVNFTFPDPSERALDSGLYILQYKWQGYGDCVDISYLNRDEPVAEIFGQLPETGLDKMYRRIDHCTFPDPEQTFGPPHQVIAGGIDICIRHCEHIIGEFGCTGIVAFPLNITTMFPPRSVRTNREDNHFSNLLNSALYEGEVSRYFTERDGITIPEIEAIFEADIANGGEMTVCIPLSPRIVRPSSTFDIYQTTTDMDDPIFYSTCYVVENVVQFEGITSDSSEISEGPWKFNSQCIDCYQRKKNAQPRAPFQKRTPAMDFDDERGSAVAAYWDYAAPVPIWWKSDKCIDCDVEPAEVPSPEESYIIASQLTTPGIPGAPTQVYCGGQYNRGPWEMPQDKEGVCPEDGSYCWKELTGVAYSPFDFFFERLGSYYHDCPALAVEDPECSPLIMVSDGPLWSRCLCWRNADCCGDCLAQDYPDLFQFNAGWDYPTLLMIDPLTEGEVNSDCELGTKSADGQFCCSESCSVCDADNNVFPKRKETVVNGDGTYLSFCVTTYIAEDRSCDSNRPPCRL